MTFVQRRLTITIKLAQQPIPNAPNVFPGSTADTITLSGLRASAKIINAGGSMPGTLDLSLYGLTQAQMATLCTYGLVINIEGNNEIKVVAGDDQGGPTTTVFVGNIYNAWGDFNASPNVAFRITAKAAGAVAVLAATPAFYKGSVDVAGVLKTLAGKMNLQFENNGVTEVTTRLSGQYLYGSLREQALALVEHAGIEWNNCEGGTLAIWPRNGFRAPVGAIPVISSTTGMRGYPTFTKVGLVVRTVFNPAIVYGRQVQVKSSLAGASQTITVLGLDHDLDAQVPGGQWFSTIRGYNPLAPGQQINPPTQ